MFLFFLLFFAEEFSELKRHTMPINFRNEGGASLHPSGDRFIAGGSDLWVRVFDYKTGEQMECLKVNGGRVEGYFVFLQVVSSGISSSSVAALIYPQSFHFFCVYFSL